MRLCAEVRRQPAGKLGFWQRAIEHIHLVALLEDHQRWDAANSKTHRQCRLGFGIDFDKTCFTGQLGRGLLKDRREAAAWATPWCPEIDDYR